MSLINSWMMIIINWNMYLKKSNNYIFDIFYNKEVKWKKMDRIR